MIKIVNVSSEELSEEAVGALSAVDVTVTVSVT